MIEVIALALVGVAIRAVLTAIIDALEK